MPMTTFRYSATLPDGQVSSGTIDADSAADARTKLTTLGLSIRGIEPVQAARVGPLSGDDLTAFNAQLSHLARAGLPVEAGLKLLAADVSRGRLKSAIDGLTRDLDNGSSLAQALAAQRTAFPPLYANVVDAGVRSGNLPGVLFNLNRHLDLVRRLRAQLSGALAYPLVLLLALVVISFFLSTIVLPQLVSMFQKTDADLVSMMTFSRWNQPRPPPPTIPVVTYAAIWFGRLAPWVFGALAAAVVGLMVAWPVLRGTSFGRSFADSFLTRLPLIGPVLRASLIGRWCDAARLGVEAGLDLPASLRLASDTIASNRLSKDSAVLEKALAGGVPLSRVEVLSLLPLTVPATIDLASTTGTLGDSLGSLADLYLRQAEHRARRIPLILTPILVATIATVVAALLAGMYLPLVRMINSISAV